MKLKTSQKSKKESATQVKESKVSEEKEKN